MDNILFLLHFHERAWTKHGRTWMDESRFAFIFQHLHGRRELFPEIRPPLFGWTKAANALVNMAWRYSPVERIHSGVPRGSPLDQRRVTLEEETEIMGYVACRLETGMATCKQLITEQPPRSWVEQIIPYALDRRICPIQWSLTETSREVRLPEPEVKGSDG